MIQTQDTLIKIKPPLVFKIWLQKLHKADEQPNVWKGKQCDIYDDKVRAPLLSQELIKHSYTKCRWLSQAKTQYAPNRISIIVGRKTKILEFMMTLKHRNENNSFTDMRDDYYIYHLLIQKSVKKNNSEFTSTL